jgi:hypothetical protein
MDEVDWPFDQRQNCAVITVRPILFDGAPILYVSHDSDDHGWQFLGAQGAQMGLATVVSLSDIVELDRSVLELADLPPGWYAWRESKSVSWQRREATT